MKFLISVLLCICESLCGIAKNTEATNEQIYNSLKAIATNQASFIGQPLSSVYNIIGQDNVPIKWFSTSTTSPYIDPNGIGYLRCIILYSASFEEIHSGAPHNVLWIEVMERNINDYEYLRNLPQDNRIEAFLNLTSSLHIKGIRFEVDKKENDGMIHMIEHYGLETIPDE